jgi:predicted MFS family arabinose efflux permease
MPAWLTFLIAIACGLIAANIYLAQPLAGPISAALGISPQAAGLIVTLTQAGYGIGLLLVVPLGDLVENRRLAVVLIGLSALALAAAAFSAHAAPFLAASLAIGLGSVAVQVLVPYAAHLAPEAARGRVVGNVMSGLLMGIMLARPVSSLLSEFASWRLPFAVFAVLMGVLALLLRLTLPRRAPVTQLHYGHLLASMGRLALRTPVLQRRGLYHAFMFGAFSLFWTTTPLLLADVFHLSQNGIALFALAGAAGAIAAPLGGRFADRGWTRPATALAMGMVVLAFAITRLAPQGSPLALALLVLAALLLDFGVSINMTLSQRAIFMLGAEVRSRLNGLYMATFFVGGAIGSALGAWAYAHGGWSAAAWTGAAMPALALLCLATERGEKAQVVPAGCAAH